jgi:hypothetical protein
VGFGSHQYCTQTINQGTRQKKVIKEIPIGKEEVKLSLFADDMILHVKDPKDSTRKFDLLTLSAE